MLRRSSLAMVAVFAIPVMLALFLAASPAASQGHPTPAAPPAVAREPAAGVYLIRLRPLGSALPDGFRVAYDRLRAALLELSAAGRVLDFEYLPDIGAARVVALQGGVEGLASRPEVAEVEPLHPQPQRQRQRQPLPAEPAQRGSAIQQTYTISGTVRTHDGTPVEHASVSTDWDDPEHAWNFSDTSGTYNLTVGVAGTYHIGADKYGLPDPPKQTVTVPPDAGGVDLTFPPTYTISGVVHDQDGHPVPGASVYGGLDVGTTAADGSYTIAEGPGEHHVSASKDGYHSPYSVLVPLPPAAAGVNLLLLQEDGTLQGQVVDDQGTPVAGALVWANNAVCDDWGEGSAQTAADGTYSLTVPSGIYHVRASKDGHVPAPPEEVAVPSGLPAAQVDLVLDRATHDIRGMVRDGAGQPLQDAWVNATTCGVSYSAETDATGAYTLPVGAGTYTVQASKTDYAGGDAQMVSVPPDASGVDLHLTARTFYTITGQVTDSLGQPIEDVVVEASWGDDWYGYLDWTDADGHYMLRVPAGTYHVSAFEHGYTRPAVQTVSVPPSRTGVDFVMSPTGLSIRGTVRDVSGNPLPVAWVSTWLPEESTSWVTDVYYDGTYVRGMTSGTHVVRASADCHVSERKLDVTLPPSRTGIDFNLVPREQLISGVVSDTNGIPLCDAKVGATPAGSGASVTDYTERNGHYALQVPAGTYTVRASKSGYGPAPDQAVTVPPYARGTDFILPAPNNTIRGMVRDNHGAAVEGATVLASNGDGSVPAASGADGGYAIQVFDGSWTVTASKAGYVTFTAPQPVSVPPDRSGVNFMLVPQGDVRRTYLPLVVRGR